jgi:hypothetical protein
MDLKAAFDWYSQLARRAGWRDYVIDRSREMAKEFPAVFGNLPAMLLKAHPKLATCSMEPSRFHAPQALTRKKEKR